MPMPLEGIRVIDWTLWQQGPVAGMMLGDLGAEVIKIEERVGGDPGRGLLSVAGALVGASEGRNFYFEANNRHKKSITLDLKKSGAQEIIRRLVAKSDVFIQNFRAGVDERLGLDYGTLSQYNPRLIYGRASGFGTLGPDAGAPAFDTLGLARSGIMTAIGEPDMPPLTIVGGIADQLGGIMLAYGVLAALIARDRHGVGQEVDISQLGSMMFLQGLNVSAKTILGKDFRRIPRAEAPNPMLNHYRCSDGKWISLAMPQQDRYWKDFCEMLGIPEVAADPRFSTMQTRAENAKELVGIIDGRFASRPRAEWMSRLKAGGDFIWTFMNEISDLPEDQQAVANEYVVDYDHPTWGPIKVIGVPVRLGKTPGNPRGRAPEFGEHTETILGDLLGYSWEDIARLKEEEVI